jgi:hypothetical protein
MVSGNKKQALRIVAGTRHHAVAKYYPESKETMKGHGTKGRSGLRSTKTTEQPLDPHRENNDKHQAPIPKEYDVFIEVIAIDEKGNATIHSDQTG